MGELGEYAKKAHDDVLSYANESADMVLLYGENWSEDETTKIFKDKETLIKYLQQNIKNSDVVLVKGSRSMKMEEVIKNL